MSFGISESVRSRAVQVCTPQLFHQAAQSGVVVKTCAEIEDALESLRRGEMNKDDYVALKTKLKAKLPILTPHATFKNGRRQNADAIPQRPFYLRQRPYSRPERMVEDEERRAEEE